MSSTNRKKLQVLTKMITRDILRIIKDFQNEKPKSKRCKNMSWELGPYQWLLALNSVAEMESEDIPEVIVSVKFRKGKTFNVSGANVLPGERGETGIEIDIETDTNVNMNWLALWNEVTNTVGHELEHVLQDEFYSNNLFGPYYWYQQTVYTEGEIAYLLSPSEIAAHVIGYAAASKNMSDLIEQINDMLLNYIKNDRLSKQEANQVMEIYKNWANLNLKQKRFVNESFIAS